MICFQTLFFLILKNKKDSQVQANLNTNNSILARIFHFLPFFGQNQLKYKKQSNQEKEWEKRKQQIILKINLFY